MSQFFASLTGDQVVNTVTFEVPQAQTPELATFQAFKLGWFFHDPFFLDYVNPPGDVNGDFTDIRTSFNFTYDWASFAAQAASSGKVDYVTFHCKNARGFRYWDSSTIATFNGGSTKSYNGKTIPQYGFSYSTGQNTHLQTAIDAFNSYGIKVVLYYNIGRDVCFNADAPNDSTNSAIYGQYDQFMEFIENDIVDLLSKVSGHIALWMDGANNWYPKRNSSGTPAQYVNYDRLWQKIKNAHPNILTLANLVITSGSSISGGNTIYFSTDMQTFEEFWTPTPDTEISDELTPYLGTDYYIPKELAWSGLYRGVDTIQYPWLEETYYGADINKSYDQSVFQSKYDYAKSLGVPMSINMPIKHDGTLDTISVSRADGIIL